MKNILVVTIDNETATYNYSKNAIEECKKKNFPYVVLGKLTGKTYAKKKAEIEQKAMDYQYIDIGGLSYGELADIQGYFKTYSKRYGLLREFKENCIC